MAVEVLVVLTSDRHALPGPGTASGHGQLRHPENGGSTSVAGRESLFAFHTGVGVVVDFRGGVVRNHQSASDQTRCFHFSEETGQEDPGIHRRAE